MRNNRKILAMFCRGQRQNHKFGQDDALIILSK